MTHLVLEQEDLGDGLRGGEPGGVAGTLVVVHSPNNGVEHVLGGGLLSQDHTRSIQRVLLIDRADAVLLDLVVGRSLTAVAEQNSPTKLLLDHETHLAADPGNDIRSQ